MLEDIGEAPVGALGNNLLWDRLDHPHLMQPEGIEPHGILGIVVAPPVGNLLQDLPHQVVAWGVPAVHQLL